MGNATVKFSIISSAYVVAIIACSRTQPTVPFTIQTPHLANLSSDYTTPFLETANKAQHALDQGRYHQSLQLFKTASTYLDQPHQIAKKDIERLINRTLIHLMEAFVRIQLMQIKEALNALATARNIVKKISDQDRRIPSNLSFLGLIPFLESFCYERMGDNKKAERVFLSATSRPKKKEAKTFKITLPATIIDKYRHFASGKTTRNHIDVTLIHFVGIYPLRQKTTLYKAHGAYLSKHSGTTMKTRAYTIHRSVAKVGKHELVTLPIARLANGSQTLNYGWPALPATLRIARFKNKKMNARIALDTFSRYGHYMHTKYPVLKLHPLQKKYLLYIRSY